MKNGFQLRLSLCGKPVPVGGRPCLCGALLGAALMLSAGAGRAAPEAAHARRRAEAWSVPELRLERMGVDRAVEHLAAVSRGIDPEGVGLNIVYVGSGDGQVPTITLTLRHVTLFEAIRWVARLSELHLRYDRNMVVLSAAAGGGDRIEHRTYNVLPAFSDTVRAVARERRAAAGSR